MIRGYAEQPSPRTGGRVTLRAATDAPLFRIEVYRCGTDLVLQASSPWLPGEDAPLHLPFQDWGEAGVGLHGESTSGTPYDITNFDPFDPTPRQTFANWDARFVGWLEREGYAVDYCTDVDLHRDGPELLQPYQLLVRAGHDEYWSDAMRAGVQIHAAAGKNVAFFGGNTCWWRVVFDDDVTFARTQFWSDAHGPGEPENTLIGVSFRNGGERDRDEHPEPVGYRVQHADHWAYAGTGVCDGEGSAVRPTSTSSATSATGWTSIGLISRPAGRSHRRARTGRPVDLPSSPWGTPGRAAGASATRQRRWAFTRRAAPCSFDLCGGSTG